MTLLLPTTRQPFYAQAANRVRCSAASDVSAQWRNNPCRLPIFFSKSPAAPIAALRFSGVNDLQSFALQTTREIGRVGRLRREKPSLAAYGNIIQQ